jgi:hypothetical protein
MTLFTTICRAPALRRFIFPAIFEMTRDTYHSHRETCDWPEAAIQTPQKKMPIHLRGSDDVQHDGRSARHSQKRARTAIVRHALDVRKLQVVGAAPGAYRRVGVIFGSVFEGERLSGVVLDGGSDWQTVRGDGATILNVRLILKTSDEALISMLYRVYATGRPTSSRASRGAKWSILRLTISAPHPYSRPRRRNTTGSIASSRSESATAETMGQSTAL